MVSARLLRAYCFSAGPRTIDQGRGGTSGIPFAVAALTADSRADGPDDGAGAARSKRGGSSFGCSPSRYGEGGGSNDVGRSCWASIGQTRRARICGAAQQGAGGARQRAVRVLIVDDEPSICKALSVALSRAGYDVASPRSPAKPRSRPSALSTSTSCLSTFASPTCAATSSSRWPPATQPQLAYQTLFMTGDITESAPTLIARASASSSESRSTCTDTDRRHRRASRRVSTATKTQTALVATLCLSASSFEAPTAFPRAPNAAPSASSRRAGPRRSRSPA